MGICEAFRRIRGWVGRLCTEYARRLRSIILPSQATLIVRCIDIVHESPLEGLIWGVIISLTGLLCTFHIGVRHSPQQCILSPPLYFQIHQGSLGGELSRGQGSGLSIRKKFFVRLNWKCFVVLVRLRGG